MAGSAQASKYRKWIPPKNTLTASGHRNQTADGQRNQTAGDQMNQTASGQQNQAVNDQQNQAANDQHNPTAGGQRNQTAGDQTNQTVSGQQNQIPNDQQTQTVRDQRNQIHSVQPVRTSGDQRNQAASASQKHAPLCVVCKERPRYSKAGTTYPTCGLSCAQKMSSHSGAQTMCCICADSCYSDGSKQYPTCGTECAAAAAKLKRSDTPPRMCNHCHQRPKFHDGVTIYPHCSTKCRDNAKRDIANQKAKLSTPSAPSKTNTACLMCWNAKASRLDLCDKCLTAAEKTESVLLLEAPRGHTIFDEVAGQFKKTWNGTQCPDVFEIYKIVEPYANTAGHWAYRDKINSNGRLNKSKANEYRQWRGTTRQCQAFDPGYPNLCSLSLCELCATIRGSFDLETVASSGIYTSNTSSRSDVHSNNVGGKKTMLLVNVLVRKEIELTPEGNALIGVKDYDAARVIGRTPDGRPDNKLIVYDKDAFQPSYILVYS